jgi:predicted Zn-dependent protease
MTLFIAGNLQAQRSSIADSLSRMDSAISSMDAEFTMQDSYYLGRSVAANILGRYPLYRERAAVLTYLNMICNAIAVNSPSPNWYNGYYVAVLDDSAPNAFATPGGHIFLTRGLIALASSEDMLAAIIAHELAHIQLKHSIAELNENRLVNDLSQIRDRAAQLQVFTTSVNEMVQTLFSRGYSQAQEFEADAMALSLLAAAGYSPRALPDIIAALQRAQPNQRGGLYSTHPAPAERIANIERQISSYRAVDNASYRRARFTRAMGR